MYKNKLKKLISSLLLALIIILPLQSHAETETLDPSYLNEILDIIEDHYVEEINREEIKGKDIKEVFNNLDEYSHYYTKEEYSKLMENLGGSLVGIGVYIRAEDGDIKVIEPIKGSPAEKAGLLPGDKILTVDAKSVRGLTADEVIKLITGEEGTTVKLRVKSGNLIKIRDVQRKQIVINPVQYQILGDIGYIKLDQFTNIAHKEIVKALVHMDKNNISKIILDLRNNPGGYLDQAVDIANLFVPRGPVVHIKYKNRGTITYNSYLKKLNYDLVVLVNENSASASEILAGAIKDRKAGQIVGVTTYGKGTVQEILQLPQEDGIKLTIAEYFSPNMNKINGTGIKPDITVENDNTEDLQLKKALELLSSSKTPEARP